MQNISNLQELTISSNNTGITDTLRVVASNNSIMQEHNLGDNDMQMIYIKIIPNNPTLPNLCVGNSKSIKEGITSVSFCKIQLQKSDINKNDFQIKDIMAIIEALQSSIIFKKMCITNKNSTREIIDGVASIICNNTLLEELDISYNNLQSTDAVKIAKALQNICTLTKLYINNNYITNRAVDDIIAVLSCNIQLKELDISSNWFQVTGIIKIAKSLQNFTTLNKLYISDNNINEKAADDIAVVICKNTQLREFNISKNCLRSKGTTKIATALQTISTLLKLYINGNNISVEAADDIANVLFCNICL